MRFGQNNLLVMRENSRSAKFTHFIVSIYDVIFTFELSIEFFVKICT